MKQTQYKRLFPMLLTTMTLTACHGSVNSGSDSGSSNDDGNETQNQAPTAIAGEDQNVHTQSAVTLTSSSTDSDGEIVQYQWTQTAGDTVSISQANQQIASFTAPVNEQTLAFELTITDNDGAVATDSITITTEYPHPFDLIDSQQQASAYAPGTLLTWSIENYDPQVQTLSWHVTSSAPLAATTLGESLEHPNQVAFTTLEVAEDTDVTITVSIADGQNNYDLSKTITMLAQGDVNFTANAYDFTVMGQLNHARLMKVTDLNNDGYNDIVHINFGGLNLLVGAADNSFTTKYIGIGEQSKDVAVADLNNDGLDDFLVSYDHTFIYSLNTGNDNVFTNMKGFVMPTGIVALSAHVGDLDNDNDNDIVFIYRVEETNTPQLAWIEQNGSSFNNFQILDAEINPWNYPDKEPNFTLGDFNNDGKTDIVVATSSTNDARPVLLYTQTDSGFNKSEAFLMYGNDSFTSVYNDNIITVDINQDGFDDVVTWDSGTTFQSQVSASHYHINQKDGTFATVELASGIAANLALFSADIDGDGDADLVTANSKQLSSCGVDCTTANSYAGSIAWIENTGAAFATELKVLGNPEFGLKTQIGDIDNDGDIDVFTLNNVSNEVWIYHNQRN